MHKPIGSHQGPQLLFHFHNAREENREKMNLYRTRTPDGGSQGSEELGTSVVYLRLTRAICDVAKKSFSMHRAIQNS